MHSKYNQANQQKFNKKMKADILFITIRKSIYLLKYLTYYDEYIWWNITKIYKFSKLIIIKIKIEKNKMII